MEEFAYSDLAAECGAEREGGGIYVRKADAGGCEILRVQIKTQDAATRIGKPMGHYVTVECGNLRELELLELEHVRCALAVEIRDMAQSMCRCRIGKGFSVLVVGLGNAAVTADSLGPKTVKSLSVTRHIRKMEEVGFSVMGLCEIAALAPGVAGQTGMEAAELVQGAVASVHPDLVVAVDALAARSVKRLASTVQLSDVGIQPGGGVGNARWPLDKKSIGVPVMAVGIPTVVNSATLVRDSLRLAGYGELSEELRETVANGQSFFVSPKEIDLLVEAASLLLAQSLEKAFSFGM